MAPKVNNRLADLLVNIDVIFAENDGEMIKQRKRSKSSESFISGRNNAIHRLALMKLKYFAYYTSKLNLVLYLFIVQ